MAGILQHLRSSTLDKRPNPASMVDGQVAINYASGSPGAFFKDTNGNLVKVGPVHVGATAPNVSPASGGTAGNSLGEQWLDTSGGTYVFKIWDGAAWRSEAGEFVNAAGDTMTGSLTMGVSANIIFEGSVDDGFETTLTVANPTADRTITLPNVTGTVVTTGDSGSVTSTMIADGTIVNADVNASAAIAGTKISPDFGSQNVITTGTSTAASFIPTSSTVPTNGVYLPAANSVALSTNGTGRLFVGSTGNTEIISAGTVPLQVSASLPRIRSNDSDGTNLTADFYTSNGTAFIDSRNDTANGAIVLRGLGGGVASEYMRITSAGNVGIGTTSPANPLSVVGYGNATTGWSVGSEDGNTSGYLANAGSTSNSIELAADPNNVGANSFMQFSVDGSERARIDSAGRLGLGTTASISPNAPLDDFHIASTDPAVLLEETNAGTDEKFWRIRADGSILRFEGVNDAFNATTAWLNVTRSTGARTADNIAFSTGTSERLRITSAGLVGIGTGTSSPDSTLNVRAGANNTTAEEIASFSRPDASVRAAISKGLISGTTNGIALGTTTNHPFALNTNGSERLYITNAGNVGIGTTSPAQPLDVMAIAANSRVLIGDSGISNVPVIKAINSTNTGSRNLGYDAAQHRFYLDGTQVFTIGTDFVFNTGGSERARIDSAGRLLVGTSTTPGQIGGTSPTVVLSETGTQDNLNLAKFRASTSGPGIQLIKSRGASPGTNTIVISGDELGRIRFAGGDNVNYIEAASIGAFVDGTPGTDDMPGRIVLSTTLDGASSPTERLRITNDGVMCYDQAAPVSYAAAATLVIGDLKNGLIQYTGAAATLTLPTGTLTEGGFSGVYTNMTFEWSVINTGSGTCTIGAGTGHTIVGGATVAAGASGRFASRRTAANTFVSYRLS